MKTSERTESYELWVKTMQEKGLSYGPADTLIAHLEAENDRIVCQHEKLIIHGNPGLDVIVVWNKDNTKKLVVNVCKKCKLLYALDAARGE